MNAFMNMLCAMLAQKLRRKELGGQLGTVLLEVMVGGTVAAIALLGLALMFANGQTLIVAEGSQRVELYLAEQKLESIRALTFTSAAGAPGSSTETVTSMGQGGAQSFTRDTCVYYVADNTLGGGPPGTTCTVGAATSTLRVRVTVTAATRQADAVTLETILVQGL